jgi:hypothetical protein
LTGRGGYVVGTFMAKTRFPAALSVSQSVVAAIVREFGM